MLILLLLLPALINCYLLGSQTITPHSYQSLGRYLSISAPSCEYPYATLDISLITAVQHLNKPYECGACLRIETPLSNYIQDGPAHGLPEVAMASYFAQHTSEFEPLPTTSQIQNIYKRSEMVRYIYVLAVDTGGQGLDLSQVAFTALFGQSMSPMPASWFPVESKHCQHIWRNSTERQLWPPTRLSQINVRVGRSEAAPQRLEDQTSVSGASARDIWMGWVVGFWLYFSFFFVT